MRWQSIAAVSLIVLTGLACDPTGPSSNAQPGAARPGVAEVDRPAVDKVVAGQVVYVPVYSHVDTADNRQPLNLSATLYVRNTDPDRPIILTRVHYYDSGGKSLREYLSRPLQVGPMASADFFVKESDVSGGPSPSFLVDWVATEAVSEPIIESVMIGTTGTQGISFTGSGRVLKSRKP